MGVSLTIGLAIIQRSLVDINTSSKVEESNRAFSAAEAGIEQALRVGTGGIGNISLPESDSAATYDTRSLLPAVQVGSTRQTALEFPPQAKEEVAQVWLANPDNTPPTAYYTQSTIDLYWGDPNLPKAAIAVTTVYKENASGNYLFDRKFYDPDVSRASQNNFDSATPTCPGGGFTVTTTSGDNRAFLCKVENMSIPSGASNTPILLRVRLLYNTNSLPFAVHASGPCPLGQETNCSIPSQAKIIYSTGTSGDTQKQVQLFQLNRVYLPLFDYAVFSAGDIKK